METYINPLWLVIIPIIGAVLFLASSIAYHLSKEFKDEDGD